MYNLSLPFTPPFLFSSLTWNWTSFRGAGQFQADAYNEQGGIVVEVEAGRGLLNYQFLKDLFQACMMSDVKYAALAVRNTYKKSSDFEIVVTFFETLYASNRLQLPLEGVLVIGY